MRTFYFSSAFGALSSHVFRSIWRVLLSVKCPVCGDLISMREALKENVVCGKCQSTVTFKAKLRSELLFSSLAFLVLALLLFINLNAFLAGAVWSLLVAIRLYRLKVLVQGTVI